MINSLQVKCCKDSNLIHSIDECIKCAAKGDCKFPVNCFVLYKKDRRPPKKISVTRLLGCIHAEYFRKFLPQVVSANLIYGSFFGSAIHSYLEKGNLPEAIPEGFMSRKYKGVEIVTKIDMIDKKRNILWEYKTNKFSPSHEIQAKLMKWIAEPRYPDLKIKLCYISKTGQKVLDVFIGDNLEYSITPYLEKAVVLNSFWSLPFQEGIKVMPEIKNNSNCFMCDVKDYCEKIKNVC